MLGKTRKEDLMCFKWNSVIREAEKFAPCLLSVLKVSLEIMNKAKASDPIIGFIISILCFYRRRSINAVQKIIAIILFAGHCSNKVT